MWTKRSSVMRSTFQCQSDQSMLKRTTGYIHGIPTDGIIYLISDSDLTLSRARGLSSGLKSTFRFWSISLLIIKTVSGVSRSNGNGFAASLGFFFFCFIFPFDSVERS